MKDGCNFLPVGAGLNTSSRVCNAQDKRPAAIKTNKQQTIPQKLFIKVKFSSKIKMASSSRIKSDYTIEIEGMDDYNLLKNKYYKHKLEARTTESHTEDESTSDDETEERRSKKKKKEKKHKKSKKKKKQKHRHSSGESDEEIYFKAKMLPSPVPLLRREVYSEDRHFYQDEDCREVRRRVPPPPPEEEWVKKDTGDSGRHRSPQFERENRAQRLHPAEWLKNDSRPCYEQSYRDTPSGRNDKRYFDEPHNSQGHNSYSEKGHRKELTVPAVRENIVQNSTDRRPRPQRSVTPVEYQSRSSSHKHSDQIGLSRSHQPRSLSNYNKDGLISIRRRESKSPSFSKKEQTSRSSPCFNQIEKQHRERSTSPSYRPRDKIDKSCREISRSLSFNNRDSIGKDRSRSPSYQQKSNIDKNYGAGSRSPSFNKRGKHSKEKSITPSYRQKDTVDKRDRSRSRSSNQKDTATKKLKEKSNTSSHKHKDSIDKSSREIFHSSSFNNRDSIGKDKSMSPPYLRKNNTVKSHRDRSRSPSFKHREIIRSEQSMSSKSHMERDKSLHEKSRSDRKDRNSPIDRKRSSSRDRSKRHISKRRSPSVTKERPVKRPREEDDVFWDSKWEASEIQKKADEKERKGRHFLAPDRKRPRTPSPESDGRSTPETEEAQTIIRLKEIQDLVVKDSEKYVAEPPNPDLFEWDPKTQMRRKKIVAEETKKKSVTSSSEEEEEEEERINTRELTLDEIEEIRQKREAKKRDKKKEKDRRKDKDRQQVKDKKEVRSTRRRTRSRTPDRRNDRRRSPVTRDFGWDRSNARWRSRSREDRRSRNSRANRSRSRDRPVDSFRGSKSAIDKAKLLAIAQRNAVKLLNSNDLKGMNKDRLMAIKSGGQSLSELTLFCRELARKGLTDEFSDDEMGGAGSDDSDGLNHPFAVRDRAIPNPIQLSVTGLKSLTSNAPKNALTLSKMTPAMREAARSHRLNEFPVSSGNAHRVKEADITLEEDIKRIPTGVKAAANAVMSLTNADDPIFRMLKIEPIANMVRLPPLPSQLIQRKLPEDKPEGSKSESKSVKKESEELTETQRYNMANPLGLVMFGVQAPTPLALKAPEPEPTATFENGSSIFKVPAIPALTSTDNPVEGTLNSEGVFEPISQPSKDISSIINIRLNAMKRLSDNPDDPVALKELYDAQLEMSTWAASKNKPGQFTGHTGAKVLSKGELTTGVQAWAKSEQFTKASKVSGGFGEYMLRKMGWREGEGLGKDQCGVVDPLQLDIKYDKKGLITAEEMVGKRGKGEVLTMTGLKDMSGKHPVTAVMEVATRRRWGPPTFTQVFECGPPHKKQYIWKCTVNGIDYQPTIASDNKKKAKSNAAIVALQELGMMAKDPNNPL